MLQDSPHTPFLHRSPPNRSVGSCSPSLSSSVSPQQVCGELRRLRLESHHCWVVLAFGFGSESFICEFAQTPVEVSSPISEAVFTDLFCSFFKGSDLALSYSSESPSQLVPVSPPPEIPLIFVIGRWPWLRPITWLSSPELSFLLPFWNLLEIFFGIVLRSRFRWWLGFLNFRTTFSKVPYSWQELHLKEICS